jgi:hypothetical protein
MLESCRRYRTGAPSTKEKCLKVTAAIEMQCTLSEEKSLTVTAAIEMQCTLNIKRQEAEATSITIEIESKVF